MRVVQSLPWIDPLDFASGLDEPYWVLLYSGAQESYSGRFSMLAHRLRERVEGQDFSVLEGRAGSGRSRFDNAWFGYIGYETGATERGNAGWISLPDLCMMRFGSLWVFDHREKTLTQWGEEGMGGKDWQPQPQAVMPAISSLHSNMDTPSYLQKAAETIERIHAGELYQANLTRKFRGEWETAPDGFALFTSLCRASPAPYSAYLRMENSHILSSSPELFLQADAEGKVRARPIKGTAARHRDPQEDAASKAALQASAKDRAENLMIADLMRNDLSKSCLPGSIRAESLFDVTTHAGIHHMSSTISGQKHPENSMLDVIRHAFPPGSMTGAPKRAAMQLCRKLEGDARGVYSGAIGWLGGDGSAELSVVIRTLVVQGRRFEFQTGGGITADSTPEGELRELLLKAGGLCRALHIPDDKLENL